MLDLSPDIAPPQPVRLADYRPPEFLVDTVDLVFDLDGANTRVKARLGIRRNPAGADPKSALHLDGEELELVSVALDGEALGANRYRLPAEGGLVIDDVPDAFALDIETLIAPDKNTALSGLYMSGGNFCTQCEPEGFRRITYFPDRPDVMARYSTTIVADKAQFPVLLSNGNPAGSGEAEQAGGTGRNGSIRTPSPPICSRWSPAIWSRSATGSPPARAGRWRSGSGCAAATRTNAAMRWAR